MNIFKLSLFILFLNLTSGSFAQNADAAATDGKKSKKETKFTEVVNTDSLPASELLARAVNWVKLENNRYEKTNGVTTASKAECIAKFPVKPKELNPECDYTGFVSLKVIVECKDNKYRYVISQPKHVSKTGKTNAGNLDNAVPECGSMIMNDIIFKKIKGEANKLAAIIIDDLKEQMKKDSKGPGDEW